MIGTYRPTVSEDIVILTDNLRTADLKELRASQPLPPLEALTLSVEVSDEANTIITGDGKIAGIFGVATVNEMIGAPWLMGTDLIPSIQKSFLKGSYKWVIDKNEHYPILMNYVHKDNKLAIQWLRFLGFNFTQLIEEYGVGKEPFYEFVRIK